MHASLRQRRRALGYTQDEVARALGLTRTGYTKIEQGRIRVSLQMARQLAHLLDNSIDSLFPLDEGGSALPATISRTAHKEVTHVT